MTPHHSTRSSDIRSAFVFAGGGETLRALFVFGLIVLGLIGVAAWLANRAVGLQVVRRGLDQGSREARDIAGAVVAAGRDAAGSIDFSRVRESAPVLQSFIHERLARRAAIHHVAVRDRFGVRQLYVARTPLEPRSFLAGGRLPKDWATGREQRVSVPLAVAGAAVEAGEGEVEVGISPDQVLEDLARQQRSLWIKVILAAFLAVTVLILGFAYILNLQHRNRALERARESADRASHLGFVAAGLAHEIRNPLSAMKMNLQMLEEELTGVADDDGEHGKLLEYTHAEIKRLEQVVNNFLSFARPARPVFGRLDLNQVIVEVGRFLEQDFRHGQVELHLDLHPMLPHVDLDETQFKQALINLLVNARQVLAGGGNVWVRTRPGLEGDVEIEVLDDGPGVPAEMSERIFDPFQSTRGGGTGLGLPIARNIVERHGGRLDLDVHNAKGALFRIHLPRHQIATAGRAETGRAR